MIQGGEEEPCLPPMGLELEEKASGGRFPCPRREPYDRDEDPLLAELAQLAAYPERAHLFAALFEATYGGRPRRERLGAVRLILRAHGDPTVAAFLWPQREES